MRKCSLLCSNQIDERKRASKWENGVDEDKKINWIDNEFACRHFNVFYFDFFVFFFLILVWSLWFLLFFITFFLTYALFQHNKQNINYVMTSLKSWIITKVSIVEVKRLADRNEQSNWFVSTRCEKNKNNEIK